MESVDPARLRSVIAVALACAPKRTKKAFADQFDPNTGPAQRELAEAVTEAVVTYLRLLADPPRSNSTPPYR
jgi:hypothetical protein